MKDAPIILAETSPASWQFSNGGEHRTRQLHELINRAGITIHAIDPIASLPNFQKYVLGLKYWLQQGRANGSPLRLVRHHGAVSALVVPALARHPGTKVLLWENTHRNNQATPYLAHQAGYSVMALPQNLESLAPGSLVVPPSTTAARLTGEVRALSRVESTFCISREEQWLLSLFGVAADFLPYYPPKAVADDLLEVRARRENAAPKRWLILGSVGNPPTFAGASQLLRLLQALPNGRDLPVDIAGYETERLRGLVSGTCYRLHGGVDQKTLYLDLLAGAKAVLLHQISGVGVLTRIPEMLLAGIPVIANGIAARSAFDLSGVHCYDSPTELGALLNHSFSTPAAPERPIKAEQRLIESMRQLIGEV